MTEETTTATITIRKGEPFLVFYGGDKNAPYGILHWAGRTRNDALTLPKDGKDGEAHTDAAKALLRKAASAEEVAMDMIAYRRGETPESAPVEERASYSGAIGDENKARTAELTDTVTRVYNSIAELSEAADALKRLQVCPDAEVAIREALPALIAASRDVEPRRFMRVKRGLTDGGQ